MIYLKDLCLLAAMLMFIPVACTSAEEDTPGPGGEVEDPVRLEAPAVVLDGVTQTSAVLLWESVVNASSYKAVAYGPDGEPFFETFVRECRLELTSLQPDSFYSVSVISVSGDKQRWLDSEETVLDFVTEGQSFEVSYSNVTETTADVSVVPAVKDQWYRIIAFRADLPDEVVENMMVKDVSNYVAAYGWEQSLDNGLLCRGDVADSTFVKFPDNYTAKFFVMGFSYDRGKVSATTGLFASEAFTTKAIPVSDAWTDMSPFYEHWEDGTEVLGVNLFPHEGVSGVRYGVFYVMGDPNSLGSSGYSEQGIRTVLLSEDGKEVDMEEEPYVAVEVSLGQTMLFSVISFDGDGIPGKVNWIILKAPLESGGDFRILTECDLNDNRLQDTGPELDVSIEVANGSERHPVYDGCPLVKLAFVPSEDCADYRFSIEAEGTFASYGEYGAADYLTNQDMRWDDAYEEGWKERSELTDDKDEIMLSPRFKGTKAELLYICFDADGVQSKAKCIVIDIPQEL